MPLRRLPAALTLALLGSLTSVTGAHAATSTPHNGNLAKSVHAESGHSHEAIPGEHGKIVWVEKGLRAENAKAKMPKDVRSHYPKNQPGAVTYAAGPEGTPDGSYTPGLNAHVATSCSGTGTDGNRVQALYVRDADKPDRYAAVKANLVNELKHIDDAFAVSAYQTGGGRRIRWVKDPGTCTISLANVVLPAGTLSKGFYPTRDAVSAAGYNTPNRHFLAFADTPMGTLGPGVCGLAESFPDSNPTGNLNDSENSLFARVDGECWYRTSTGGSAAGHELAHTLGAVQSDSPHATAYGHCTDEYDLMCYDDGSSSMNYDVCPVEQNNLLDCGHDDYFHTNPAAGSYLATHWNIARSTYLENATPLAPPAGVTLTVDRATAETGDTITFTATGPSGATATWAGAPAACIKTTTSLTLTLNCPHTTYGTYAVTAQVTQPGNPMFATANKTVTVTPAADVTLSASNPSTAEAGKPFATTITATAGKAPFTFTWENRNPAECTVNSITKTSTSTTITRTCSSALVDGASEVFVEATAADTATAGQAYASIITAPATNSPSVNITGPATLDAGQTGTYTVTTQNAGTSPTYQWSTPQGWITGPTTGPTTQVTAPGSASGTSTTLRVSMFVNGNVYNAYYAINVVQPYTLTVTQAPSTAPAGTSAAFKATTNRASTFTWASPTTGCGVAPSNTSTTTTGTLTCDAGFTGAADVTVTATDSNNNTRTQTRTITYYDGPVGPNLTLTGPTSVYAGRPFTMTVTNSGTPVSGYTWTAPPACVTAGTPLNGTATSLTFRCPATYSGNAYVTVKASGDTTTIGRNVLQEIPDVTTTLTPSTSNAYAGTNITLSMAVRGAAGNLLKARIRLEKSYDGGNWTTLFENVDEDGLIARTETLTRTAWYRFTAVDAGASPNVQTVRLTPNPTAAVITSRHGWPTTFGGYITDTRTGKRLPGVPVKFQIRWAGTTTWTTIRTLTSTSTGTLSTFYAFTKNHAYFRYAYAGNTAHAADLSGERHHYVFTQTGITVRSAATNRIICLLRDGTGAILPGRVVQLQRYNGSAWVNITQIRTNRYGKAAYATPRNGLYRWATPRQVKWESSRSATKRAY